MHESESLDVCLLALDLRNSDLQHLHFFSNDYCLWNVILNLELNQNSEKKTSNKNQEFFDSVQKLETTQVPIDRWTVKQNVVHNIQWNKMEISVHVKKEVLNEYSMNEPWKRYATWNKLNTKG